MRRMIKIIDILILFAFCMIIGISVINSILISLFIFLGIYAFRTYDIENMKDLSNTMIRTIIGIIIGFLFVLTPYLIFSEFMIKRTQFIWVVLFTLIIIPILHKIEYTMYEKRIRPKRYLVIGRKNEIGNIMDEISEKSLGKYLFAEYLNPSPEKLHKIMSETVNKLSEEDETSLMSSGLRKIRNLHLDKIYGKNNQNYIDAIMITDPKLEEFVEKELEEYKKIGIKIEYLPLIAEKYLKRIPIEVVTRFHDYYDIIFENIFESPVKRIIDIFSSLCLLILFSPFMLMITIFTFIEDGMPIVFRQERIGKDEKAFIMHKFRSLKNKKERKNDDEIPSANDDIEKRILKIGKFTRKFRIDETLQFYNVLKGEMSIVGSRPEMLEFHDYMKEQIPFYTKRLNLKPGITGWAQINYKHTTTTEDYKRKTEYDLYYTKNRSSILDLQIMLKTMETMIGMKGAR